jgi:hypothetical protein
MGVELGFPILVSWPQWLRLSVGLLRGTVVMSGAQWRSRVTRGAVESSGQRWGSGLFLSFSSRSHGRGLDREDRGRQHDTLIGAGTLWEGQRGGWLLVLVLTCNFADFCPPCVRPKVRKKSKFEFLKNSNWGCQGIQQGFQKYFCCAER